MGGKGGGGAELATRLRVKEQGCRGEVGELRNGEFQTHAGEGWNVGNEIHVNVPLGCSWSLTPLPRGRTASHHSDAKSGSLEEIKLLA